MSNKFIFFIKKHTPNNIKSFFNKKYSGELIEYFKYYDDYCAALDKCLNDENEVMELSYLFKEFQSNSIKYNYFECKWWKQFIYAAKVAGENLKLQNYLSNIIEEIPVQDIDIRDFIHFYNISLMLGLFHVGYHLREKAILSAIGRVKNRKVLDAKDYFYGVPALYEKNEHSYLLGILNENESFKNVEYSKFLKIINSKNDKKNKTENISNDFHSFIQGKSIAIVGPAKSLNNDAKEIDSYDIVVRCNYKEEGIGVDNLIKGVRCDISYYNGTNVKYLMASNLQNFPKNIDWIVFDKEYRHEILKKKFKELGINNKYRFKLLNRANKYLFNGRPNAIPNIVYDLLLHKPAQIKIFHADFMLTVGRSKGYFAGIMPKDFNRKKKELRSISRNHDPISQFRFMKNLYNKNLIEGDKRFEEVINLSTKEFMTQLNEIYAEVGYFKE